MQRFVREQISDSEEDEIVFELVDEISISNDEEDEEEEVVNEKCEMLNEKQMMLYK